MADFPVKGQTPYGAVLKTYIDTQDTAGLQSALQAFSGALAAYLTNTAAAATYETQAQASLLLSKASAQLIYEPKNTGAFVLAAPSASRNATYSGTGSALLFDFISSQTLADEVVLVLPGPLTPGSMLVFALEDTIPPSGGVCDVVFSEPDSFRFGAGGDFTTLRISGDATGGPTAGLDGVASFFTGDGVNFTPLALGPYYSLF